MPSVPMFCKVMRALHISSDEYVWPNRNRDNPTYQSLLNLLSQCDGYKLSVLHVTAEALLRDAPDSQKLDGVRWIWLYLLTNFVTISNSISAV